MGAFANYQWSELEFARLGDGKVGLADVQSVGARSDSDIGAVINYADNAVFSADACEFDGQSVKLVVFQALRSYLNAVGTPDGTLPRKRYYFGGNVARYYDIQPDAIEPAVSITEQNNVLFERVSVISQLFDCRGQRAIPGSAYFRKGAQRLAQSLAGGNETIIQIAAATLAINSLAHPDVAGRISARYQPAHIEPSNCRRQFMPKLLCPFRKRHRIQSEAAELLHHTGRLAGPIEIRIDDSVRRALHNNADYTAQMHMRTKKNAARVFGRRPVLICTQ